VTEELILGGFVEASVRETRQTACQTNPTLIVRPACRSGSKVPPGKADSLPRLTWTHGGVPGGQHSRTAGFLQTTTLRSPVLRASLRKAHAIWD
jgi:hypothetical protein